MKDLSTPEKPFLPLYVEAGGSLYQVAGLFPAKGDNDDDAVREGNALMLKRQDTALICSTEATQSGEVATIHIVSSLAKAA